MSFLTELLLVFKNNFQLIEENSFELIHNLYNEHLFKRNIQANFKIDGELVSGKIISCTKQGTLLVKINGECREFLHKQLELIF